MNRYTNGCKGWVGRSTATLTKRDGTTLEVVHWWEGPKRGWGTSYGNLNDAAVFPTRAALVETARGRFGRMWQKHMMPQAVRDAEAECADRWITHWERFCSEAGVKPDNKYPAKTLATRWENRTGGTGLVFQVEQDRANYTHALSRKECW
jgi:hypothetical protein